MMQIKLKRHNIVRNSKKGEEFTALDNKNYKLENGMCVIAIIKVF